MKSPFPGMDPYMEQRWRDLHHSLIQYTRDSLQPCLPEDLCAGIDERVFLETDGESSRSFYPDVGVSYQSMVMREGGTMIAEPLVFESEGLEIAEGYIEIREARGGKVITVIEFLSPANKRAGAGQEEYRRKQAEVLRSDASLVEIDLVRKGQRVLALPAWKIPPEHRADYLACISPGWRKHRRELYLMPLRQRLPALPIPLRHNESSVTVDLQALLDKAYIAGRYRKLDYSAELDPPLSPEDQAWASELLAK